MQRIQLVGTQRSGSNLLRLMLDQSPQICAPPSTHLLEVFTSAIDTYGDLSVPKNRRAVLTDAQELINRNVLQWPDEAPPLNSNIDVRLESAIDLFFLAYDREAQRQGSGAWVCKSLENLKYMDALLDADPMITFVHLVRDGRDVALSFSNAPIGPKDPYIAGRKWATEQQVILDFQHKYPSRVWTVHYESLVNDPPRVISELHQELGLGPTGEVEKFFESSMARRTRGLSDLWTNLSQPLMRSNTGKFRDPGHRGLVAAFEAVAGEMLEQLGYQRLTPVDATREVNWSEAEANDASLRLDRVAQNDPATERRHAHYESFVEMIQGRGAADAGSASIDQITEADSS